MVTAGFPCQDISLAGEGEGIHGNRSSLFFDAVRIARTLKARWIVLENVSAITTRGLDVVLATLADSGFNAASDHKGAPRLATINRRAAESSRGVRLPEELSKREQIEVRGKLNPNWVEWLMGYPEGWTDLKD